MAVLAVGYYIRQNGTRHEAANSRDDYVGDRIGWAELTAQG